MKIGLFGGAFDPPHLGHQGVVKEVLDRQIFDQVWYVPAKQHPFAKEMSSVEHRLAMLELLPTDPRIKIETYELDKNDVSYTHQTLDYLVKKYPQHQFAWIIGSDNLVDFHLWEDNWGRNYKQLLSDYQFYVYPRGNYPFKPLYEGMIALKDLPQVTISSSQVRDLQAAHQPISELVSPVIEAYIHDQGLYCQ